MKTLKAISQQPAAKLLNITAITLTLRQQLDKANSPDEKAIAHVEDKLTNLEKR